MFWRRHGNENISIWAGTIDDKTGLEMTSQIHVESKGDYYDLPNVEIIDQAVLK